MPQIGSLSGHVFDIAMKILVVDDHVLIREALRGLFKELTWP